MDCPFHLSQTFRVPIQSFVVLIQMSWIGFGPGVCSWSHRDHKAIWLNQTFPEFSSPRKFGSVFLNQNLIITSS